MGPAYAYTCLLLRFDPKTAYKDGQAHPSYEKRAYAILQTLEEMDKSEDSRGLYSGILKNLRSWWTSSVKAARPAGLPTSDDKLYRLEKLVTQLHYRLYSKMPRVQYSGWPQAARISRQLADQQSEAAMVHGLKLRDVLNGAWRCRTNPPGGKHQNGDNLSKSAKDLCEWIVTEQEPKAAV
jgi:hypothetical protein